MSKPCTNERGNFAYFLESYPLPVVKQDGEINECDIKTARRFLTIVELEHNMMVETAVYETDTEEREELFTDVRRGATIINEVQQLVNNSDLPTIKLLSLLEQNADDGRNIPAKDVDDGGWRWTGLTRIFLQDK